jgi:hypothetical protein
MGGLGVEGSMIFNGSQGNRMRGRGQGLPGSRHNWTVSCKHNNETSVPIK